MTFTVYYHTHTHSSLVPCPLLLLHDGTPERGSLIEGGSGQFDKGRETIGSQETFGSTFGVRTTLVFPCQLLVKSTTVLENREVAGTRSLRSSPKVGVLTSDG